MVQLTMKITAASGHAHHLVDALHVVMQLARQSSNCSGSHIAADVDEAGAFWYVEDWQDQEALRERLQSDGFSQLLALMETSVTTPSLEFRMVEESRGLDYVAAVRQVKGWAS